MDSRGRFDLWADRVAGFVASAYFFTACVLAVVLWVPTLLLLDVNTSQLVINTFTTIVTFLMIALLHNDASRFERSVSARLEVIMQAVGAKDPVHDEGQKEL